MGGEGQGREREADGLRPPPQACRNAPGGVGASFHTYWLSSVRADAAGVLCSTQGSFRGFAQHRGTRTGSGRST